MKKLLVVSLLWTAVLASTNATPLGTAFTYSGRLKYQNQPANGNFDLQVKLFDAATAGNQVGQTLNVNALSIVNGLFLTSLDFGAGIFNGNAYWLEIAARPSGNGPFTLLSPRQPVNPAPYALFAPTAGLANATAANSISSSSLQNNSVTAAKIASGQVVKSVNGLSDNVNLTAGANITITPNGNTLSIASSSGASGWSLTGNSGTTPGVNFIGTTDNKPFEMRANNVRALRVENVGSIFAGYSMNWIGGEVINQVMNGAIGATIAGGGWFNPSGSSDSPNVVSGNFGTVGGGAGNTAAAAYATIPGGFGNQASGVGSFAAGQLARAVHDGSFLWNDGTQTANSSGPNRFEVLSHGGATFHTGSSYLTEDGPFLVVNGLGSEQAYFGGDGAGGDVQLGSLNPTISNVALWNGGNSTYMNLYVATLTITGGSDLAEPFNMSDDVPQGSVVVIDEARPGQLKLSNQQYDTRVAGIVSGANGINPGLSLHQTGKFEGGQDVALSGRVYVLADASHGPINPGDLLTSSEIPGHAMKAADHTRAQGAIIGKAMSGLKQGKGMVLVLVTLQ